MGYRTSDITAMINPDDKQKCSKTAQTFDKDVDQINLSTTFNDIVPCLKAMNIISPGVLALFDSTYLSIDQLLGKAISLRSPFISSSLGVIKSNICFEMFVLNTTPKIVTFIN